MDWCTATDETLPGKPVVFDDIGTLKKYKFAFHIALSDYVDLSTVEAMISKELEDKFSVEFIERVMSEEESLVILDNLDEWSKQMTIPRYSSTSQSTVLTLTRPWKMYEACVKNSEIDSLFVIKGVRDSNHLAKNVMKFVNETNKEQKFEENFIDHIQNLSNEFFKPPIVTIQLIALWLENGFKMPNSVCKIYADIIDMLFQRQFKKFKVDTGKSYLSLPCFRKTLWSKESADLLEKNWICSI